MYLYLLKIVRTKTETNKFIDIYDMTSSMGYIVTDLR